jgi:hypothetical protein
VPEIPVTRAVAEYRGKRFQIAFGGDDWVSLRADAGTDIPDAFARGESPNGPGHYESWAKVPMSVLDGVIDVRVRGTIAGHTVSPQRRLPDGRIGVEFVGPPAVARALGWMGISTWGGPASSLPKNSLTFEWKRPAVPELTTANRRRPL